MVNFFAQRRKTVVAVLTPFVMVASNYLGPTHVNNLWYWVVIGELSAIGVHTVTNSPPPTL